MYILVDPEELEQRHFAAFLASAPAPDNSLCTLIL
jgi:hypothetical protein